MPNTPGSVGSHGPLNPQKFFALSRIESVTGFQPDEDYWQNWVQPAQSVNALLQPWSFGLDSDFVAPTAAFQPDEDYCWPSLRPQAAAGYQRLSPGDPEELPAGTLVGPNFRVSQTGRGTLLLGNPNDQIAQIGRSALILGAPNARVAQLGRATLLLASTFLDEDLWQRWFPTATGAYAYFCPWADTDFAPPFQPDEDYWLRLAVPAAGTYLAFSPRVDPDFIGAASFQPDEDLWLAPLRLIPATNRYLAPWQFDDGTGVGTARRFLQPQVCINT